MEMWMKIAGALLLGVMLFMFATRGRDMLQNSPDAKPGDWPAFILPIILIGGFIALLMYLV